jgi:hypothetical protein
MELRDHQWGGKKDLAIGGTCRARDSKESFYHASLEDAVAQWKKT